MRVPWTQIFLLFATSIGVLSIFYEDQKYLKIGSFNVKWFTVKKSTNQDVVKIVSKVVNRYDVMLMIEIRDDSQLTAMNRLWTEVNKTAPYGLYVSDKLGRSSYYKEEYGFFYRLSTVDITKKYQYNDSRDNEYEREPYSVYVTPKDTDIKSMALIGSHIKPSDANAELTRIPEVIQKVETVFGTSRVVFMGDLNADCSYMSQSNLDKLKLRTDYNWLISDKADTTVSTHTDCAYDRIIITKQVHSAYSGVFYFDKAYGLNFNQAWNVSDHYPVEAYLY